MGTFIVQFRQDETARDFLQKAGLNPNEFGRVMFERGMREAQNSKNMDELNRMKQRIAARLKGRRLFEKPVAELVREDRDSH